MSSEPAPHATHEAVHRFYDDVSGLKAIIALHSSALGPSAGGCRVWKYEKEEDAVHDALRLSEGMTYKNALAGLPFGGGKAVIMLPENAGQPDFDRAHMFETFGSWVDGLKGAYVTAEDVGCTVQDMQMVRHSSRYVAGLPAVSGLAGGDPSPWTAKGVFLSIEALVKRRFGSDLKGVVVGVQGLGHVGFGLCRLLHDAGAKLLVSDIDAQSVTVAEHLYNAQVVKPEKMAGTSMDVFAPCAMGGVVTEHVADTLNAAIICGAANNQLLTAQQGQQLADRGIVYAPDYLVNAGGIINVSAEYMRETPASVEKRVMQIPQRLLQLVERSEREGIATNFMADKMAKNIVDQARVSKVA